MNHLPQRQTRSRSFVALTARLSVLVVCSLMASGCRGNGGVPAGDDGSTSGDGPAGGDGSTSGDGPAGGDGSTSGGPRFLSGPTITANPNPAVPLAAIISFTTDVTTTARFVVVDGNTSRDIAFREESTEFSLPLLGIEADKTYTIDVTVSDTHGNETTAPAKLSFTTDPLPVDFPPIDVKISQPGLMEPGVILFSPRSTNRMVVAVDEDGKVIWYWRAPGESLTVVSRFQNGNLLCIKSPRDLCEIDMLGNVVKQWHATAKDPRGAGGATGVDADYFHHDAVEMPSGNILALSTELRVIDNFPSSETDPSAPKATATVVGDLIIEFQRDGTVVGTWSLLDILDPLRIGYDSLNSKKAVSYPSAPGPKYDWSHSNAVIYDGADDSIIVSVRHQDALCKISRQTGTLIWILGPHENWTSPWSAHLLTAQGSLEWPYHQHAPMITPGGTILLFDNGNHRASPFSPPMAAKDSYSRAVEYVVDPSTMEVSQVWTYGGPGDELFYSSSISDANWLTKTGNILVTDGARKDPQNGDWARIVEVTHTTPATKVFEMEIRDTSSNPVSWKVSRSEKLPSLYPATMVH